MAWYDEKDEKRESVQDEIWLSHPTDEEIKKQYETYRSEYSYLNEIERHEEAGKYYSIFQISEKYNITYKVDDFSSDFVCEDKDLLRAFKLELFKNSNLKEYSKMSIDEQDNFIEKAISKFNIYMEKSNEYIILLQIFANYLKERGEKSGIVKIGVGYNLRSGNPNFQIYLDINTLKINQPEYYRMIDESTAPEAVNLYGSIYTAKNYNEIKNMEPEEYRMIAHNGYGFRHEFRYSSWFDCDLYKYTSELYRNILAFNRTWKTSKFPF